MSLLETAVPAENIVDENWIKALLVGESKRGKTRSSITFPFVKDSSGKEKPKLAIGLTPRTRVTIAGLPNVKLIEIFEDEGEIVTKQRVKQFQVKAKAFEQLYELVMDLWTLARDKEKEFPYSGIVLDDLSQTSRITMNHVLGLKKSDGKETEKNIGGVQAMLHYVPYMHYLHQVINSFLLPLPCHVVVCGHLDLRENEDGLEKYFPKVWGSIRSEVGSWFNEVFECISRTDKKSGETTYFWDTIGSGKKDMLGSSLNKEGKLWTSPFRVDLSESPCGFAKMLQMLKEGGTK